MPRVRSIVIVASPVDELALLDFLRSTADIQLLTVYAPTPAELFIKEAAPYGPLWHTLLIWNRAYPWTPRTAAMTNPAGWVYIRDYLTAPVIVLHRTDIAKELVNLAPVHGSLSWAKHHMSDDPPYDVPAFGRWFDRVVRWVKKVGTLAADRFDVKVLHLPDAWLLRDCVRGPQTMSPWTCDTGWLTWQDGTLPRIARRIRDEKHFQDMPILADAWEEAGCTDAAILGHCRAQVPHHAGCWALALLLGRPPDGFAHQ